MKITLNGRSLDSDRATLQELLASVGIETERPGLAVAVNDVVVPRAGWAGHVLCEGDFIEVITAMAGG